MPRCHLGNLWRHRLRAREMSDLSNIVDKRWALRGLSTEYWDAMDHVKNPQALGRSWLGLCHSQITANRQSKAWKSEEISLLCSNIPWYVEISVPLSLTRVGIGTLANARGLRFVRILLKYIHVIKYSLGVKASSTGNHVMCSTLLLNFQHGTGSRTISFGSS